MYIDNILIDKLCDIIFYYYKSYRYKLNNIININTEEVHSLLHKDLITYLSNYHLSNKYEIESIDVLMFPYEERYYNLDYKDLINIKYNLDEYFTNGYIHNYNEEIVISININPFEGIYITHGYILQVLDLFFL